MRKVTLFEDIAMRETRSKQMRAPIFSRIGIQLYHGDAMDVLGEMPEESADMIFADPPPKEKRGCTSF